MRPLLIVCLFAAALRGQPAHWWEKEPLRIIDVVTSFNQLGLHSPAEWAARKAAQGYNTEHLEVMTLIRGLDDRGFFFNTRVAGRQNRDFLREYLPEASRRGIRTMVYFNVHWYTREFGDQHRDWLQIREDGTPLGGVYVTGTDFCVNGPWREWVFQVLRDLAAYPIDGIFFDGPIFFPETCYCRYCREKYANGHQGAALPSKKQRKGTGARDLLEFQAGSLTEFLRDSRAVLKAVNPEIAFYMNGGERGGNWATARLNRALIREQDLLGSEGGFIGGDLTRVPIWKPGVTARLLESQAGGKPRIIFSAAGHKPWTFSLLPAPELRLLYAGTIANAAGVWFGMWPFEFDQPEMSAIAEMNRFLERNATLYQGTRSEAKVALVWSDTTANFYAGSDAQLLELERVPERREIGNLGAEFAGFADAILRSRTPFDVIDDVTIESGGLGRYAAVVLPNVACVGTKTAAALRDYVRGGGNLLSTFETSLYDDVGNRREDFALSDVFGVSSAGVVAGPKRWDFMKPLAASPLLDGLAREMLPAPPYHLRVKAPVGRELLRFYKQLTGVYDGIPTLSDDPALVVNRFGKGTSVYFAGDLGAGIDKFHMGEFFRLVGNSLQGLAPSPVTLENAPGSVELVLRSQDNGRRLLLHIINSTGEMTRPIERIVPLPDVHVSLQAGAGFRSARTLMAPRALELTQGGGGRVRFTVPLVREYEVVVLER